MSSQYPELVQQAIHAVDQTTDDRIVDFLIHHSPQLILDITAAIAERDAYFA